MPANGAQLSIAVTYGEGVTRDLDQDMLDRARNLCGEPDNGRAEQLHNRDAVPGYVPLGDEVWQDRHGEEDTFMHAVGRTHSIHGTTRALWDHNRDTHNAAFEPV